MSEAKKFDLNKPPMHLLDRVALEATAQVLAFGAQKYAEDNWRGGGTYDLGCKRPLAAALRHIFAYLDGECSDPESDMSHLAHAMCSIMFALSADQRGFSDVVRPAVTYGAIKDTPA